MPYKYGGRRSQGCNLCRKRKVRCGEEKPVCTRCRRLEEECVYRDRTDLYFHDETAHASARAERLWLSRATQDSSCESPVLSPGSSSSRSSTREDMPLYTYAIKQSLEEVALARFNHDFILEQGDKLLPLGYLEYVPRLYGSSLSGSSVGPVVEAVALASFGRRCHCPPQVSATAAAKYGIALRLTSEALNDPARMLQHETVMSCYLLGMYELLVPSATTFTDWNKHNQGGLALLKLRGRQQIDDPTGMALFKQIYAAELVFALRFCLKPVAFPEMSQAATGPVQFLIFSALGETSKLMAEFLGIMDPASILSLDAEINALHNILVRSQNLLSRIKQILSALPADYAFELSRRAETAVSAPRWLQRIVRDKRGPEYYHKKYSNVNIANGWNWMRQSQVRLVQLQIIVSKQLGLDWQRLQLRMWEIVSLVDDMESTIVYLLTCDDTGGFNTSDKIEDVRGVRCFLLVRILAAAKMALEFIDRQGVDVQEKLAWLSDVSEFLRSEFGFEAPMGPDPMDLG